MMTYSEKLCVYAADHLMLTTASLLDTGSKKLGIVQCFPFSQLTPSRTLYLATISFLETPGWVLCLLSPIY